MKLYAIKIQKSHLELLTILNGGVTPQIEKRTTYLIIDATETIPNEIVTEREFYADPRFDISTNSPLFLKLKK